MISKLASDPRKLFLLDGAGAVVSMLMMAVVLPLFNSYLGLPAEVLKMLAIVAAAYSLYSLGCAVLVKNGWRKFLYVIACANFLHCCLSLSVMIYYRGEIKIPAIIYFTGEITIVALLGWIELQAAAKNK